MRIFFIFLISIILHEFTHMIIGMIFGYKLKNLKILPFGISIEFKEHTEQKCQIVKNTLIYISGPLSNVVISVIFINNLEICYTNIFLCIFNLLPILPLDGGNILREILKFYFGNKNGNLIGYKISRSFLCVFTFLYSIFILKIKNLYFLFLIAFLWYLDYKECNKIETMKKVYKIIEKESFYK